MIENLNGWADAWAGFMWRGVVEGSLLLAILLIVWLPLRRRVPAQAGYCLFLLVLLKVLVPVQVPVPGWLAYASPRYSLERVVSWATTPSVAQGSDTAAVGAADFQSSEQHSHSRYFGMRGADGEPLETAGEAPQTATQVGNSQPLSLAAWLMLAWSAVVSGLAIRFVAVQGRMQRLIGKAAPVDAEVFGIDFASLLRLAGVEQKVEIVATSAVSVPAVWGLWRPRIVVPPELLDQLTANQLTFALLHELAHIRRRDLVVVLIQRLVQIVFFFNPAVWIANWLADREREYACDDAALAACSFGRRDCGQGFLRIVEFASAQPMAVAPALGLFGGLATYKAFIRSRLMRILDTKRAVQSRLSLVSAAMLVMLAAILLPQVRAQQKADNQAVSSEKKTLAGAKAAPAAANATVKEITWPFRSESANQELSFDGTRLLLRRSPAAMISIIDLATNRETEIVSPPAPQRAWTPEWSRLGGQIVYTHASFDQTTRQSVVEIRTVSTSGGEPRTVYTQSRNITPVDWSYDGKWILCNCPANQLPSLWYVPVEGGGAKKLVDFGKDNQWASGRIAPSGDMIAYKRVADGKPGIFVFVVEGQREIPIETGKGISRDMYNQPVWSANGRYVIYARDPGDGWHFYGQQIKDQAPVGEPVLIHRTGANSWLRMLNDGRLLYSTVDYALPKLYSVSINEQTGELLSKPVVIADRFPFDKYSDLVLSPDGQWLAGRAEKEGTSDFELCLVRVDGSQPRHIATELKTFRPVGWLAGGKSMLVSGMRDETNGKLAHFRVDLESGAVELLLSPHAGGAGRLSADGRQLAFSIPLDGVGGLHVSSAQPGAELALLRRAPGESSVAPVWSPDGKSIAFLGTNPSDRTKRRLMIMPAGGGEARVLSPAMLNKPNNDFHAWSPNGKFIAFNKERPGGGDQAGVWLISPDGGKPIYLDLDVKYIYSHVWSADGKSLMFTGINEEDQSHLWSLENYLPAE